MLENQGGVVLRDVKGTQSDVNVITYHEYVSSRNISDMIADYDFIIDGADNFPTKFLINDACVLGESLLSCRDTPL